LIFRVVAAVAKYERDLEPVMSSSKAHAVEIVFFKACRFGWHKQEVLNLELVVILSETQGFRVHSCKFLI